MSLTSILALPDVLFSAPRDLLIHCVVRPFLTLLHFHGRHWQYKQNSSTQERGPVAYRRRPLSTTTGLPDLLWWKRPQSLRATSLRADEIRHLPYRFSVLSLPLASPEQLANYPGGFRSGRNIIRRALFAWTYPSPPKLPVSLTVKCYAIGSHSRRQNCGV